MQGNDFLGAPKIPSSHLQLFACELLYNLRLLQESMNKLSSGTSATRQATQEYLQTLEAHVKATDQTLCNYEHVLSLMAFEDTPTHSQPTITDMDPDDLNSVAFLLATIDHRIQASILIDDAVWLHDLDKFGEQVETVLGPPLDYARYLKSWVMLECLDPLYPQTRARAISNFIILAHELAVLNAFNAMTAIIDGLSDPLIDSLLSTWSYVKNEHGSQLPHLSRLRIMYDCEHAMKNMRSIVNKQPSPCTMPFEILRQDLRELLRLRVEERQSDQKNGIIDSTLVHGSKSLWHRAMQQWTLDVELLKKAQRHPYEGSSLSMLRSKEDLKLEQWLLTRPFLDSRQLIQLREWREPKMSVTSNAKERLFSKTKDVVNDDVHSSLPSRIIMDASKFDLTKVAEQEPLVNPPTTGVTFDMLQEQLGPELGPSTAMPTYNDTNRSGHHFA